MPGGKETAQNRFGLALSTGDYDNNGRDDLLIGTPFAAIGSLNKAGRIYAMYADDQRGPGGLHGGTPFDQDTATDAARPQPTFNVY